MEKARDKNKRKRIRYTRYAYDYTIAELIAFGYNQPIHQDWVIKEIGKIIFGK